MSFSESGTAALCATLPTCAASPAHTPFSTQVLKPSSYLDVEMKTIQQQLLDPKPMDFMMHEIAKATTGEAAKQSMAKRKLDALGQRACSLWCRERPEAVEAAEGAAGAC